MNLPWWAYFVFIGVVAVPALLVLSVLWWLTDGYSLAGKD